jgi:hypothetical protein
MQINMVSACHRLHLTTHLYFYTIITTIIHIIFLLFSFGIIITTFILFHLRLYLHRTFDEVIVNLNKLDRRYFFGCKVNKAALSN